MQLVNEALERFELAQAVRFSDLAQQFHLQVLYSQLQSQYTNYLNKIFIDG